MRYIIILTVVLSAGEYNQATESRKNNAVIVIVQDGCAPCRQQEHDLISVLANTGFLYDSKIIVVSVDREPKLASALMGENNLMTPHTIICRDVNSTRYGFRYSGYGGKQHFESWLNSVRQWKPLKKST